MNKFDFNKIKDFDKHIDLSIPNYGWLNDQIVNFSQYFIERFTNVYDIGCSTGKLLKRLQTTLDVDYYGIDNSTLLPKANGVINFIKEDLRQYNGYLNASFITSIFTLQFMERAERKKLIKKIEAGLNKYGAFIICEKTYSNSPMMQDIINSMYYKFKENSFSSQEILKKERELRYNLKMLKLDDILNELRVIGEPEIFWRSFNFVGCIVVKI